jgi:hypothetical protein
MPDSFCLVLVAIIPLMMFCTEIRGVVVGDSVHCATLFVSQPFKVEVLQHEIAQVVFQTDIVSPKSPEPSKYPVPVEDIQIKISCVLPVGAEEPPGIIINRGPKQFLELLPRFQGAIDAMSYEFFNVLRLAHGNMMIRNGILFQVDGISSIHNPLDLPPILGDLLLTQSVERQVKRLPVRTIPNIELDTERDDSRPFGCNGPASAIPACLPDLAFRLHPGE